MPILIRIRHFGHDFLDIFICSFYCPIYLGTVWCRIVVLYLELLTDLFQHLVIQIGGVIQDDPFWNPILAYNLFLDETINHKSSNAGI